MQAPTNQIQIKPGKAGRLVVLLPYSAERVAKIKTILGRRWHQSEKCWTLPHTDGTLNHVLTLFAGEPVEVDPSLRPTNTPAHRKPPHEPERPVAVAITLTLLDQVRQAIRARHYSYRTEEAYVGWVRRFFLFHNKRHPAEIGAVAVSRFLTSLYITT